MTERTGPTLSGVAETLLLPLYLRAVESKRPDALIQDEKAVALIGQLNPDSTWIKQMRVDEEDMVGLVLRNRQFDDWAREFLARHPEAVVVHIGCGLDTRFDRLDNGRVEWYDLDLPEVIELRRQLMGDEAGRYHLLACSAFDAAWTRTLSSLQPRPFLFLAEGVFMYFEQGQVRSLVLKLRDQFPGSELAFDAFSPFLVRMNNLRIRRTKIGARYRWGLKRGRDLERWGDGITLLEAWHPFDRPEPRLSHVGWMRHVPPLARVMGIFHYRLGEVSE